MKNDSDFYPAWWLTNPHLQTIYPSLFRLREKHLLQKERLELNDGDFLDLAWMPEHSGDLCLVMHGLEGSLHSHYAGGIIQAAHDSGKHTVFMHFRGCSGEPNRLTRRYHSGETGDLRFVLETLHSRYPNKRIHVVAVSLGGNMLLKYLGENGNDTLVESVMVISVPFDLAVGAVVLNTGFAKAYQGHLLDSLQVHYYEKYDLMEMPIPRFDKDKINTIYDFDDLVTAPLHGFKNADDYYQQCSSRQFVPGIKTPTWIIHAIDDPFMTPEVIPTKKELPADITLKLSQHGGHVGFVSGNTPLLAHYWIDDCVRDFLSL